MTIINGVDVDKTQETQELAKKDPSSTDRQPKIVARWLGNGSAARIEFGEVTSQIGGEGKLNSMQTLLASLAACDIDVVATHAALLGLAIEELWIEATGHFNSRAYYGIDGGAGPGYDNIAYTVHLKAPGATDQQINYLKERCDRSSPVGDSLSKSIPLALDIEVE